MSSTVFLNQTYTQTSERKYVLLHAQVTQCCSFVQPKVDARDICILLFCVTTNSSRVKIFWNKTICNYCMWNVEYYQDIKYRQEISVFIFSNELQTLSVVFGNTNQKAHYSKVDAATIFKLGGYIYYGRHGFQKNVKKHKDLDSFVVSLHPLKMFAIWLCATERLIQKATEHIYTSKKAAILGNAKAIFLLGH